MGWLKGVIAFAVTLAAAMPVAGQTERRDIPFKLHHGYLIVVKGSIGKLKNLSFVVDTGSYRSILDQRIAQKLHLKLSRSIEQMAPNHIVTMNSVLVPGLSWGGRTMTPLTALVFDLSPISRFMGIHEDMLLGLDVLRQASFQVDFQTRRIHFGNDQEPEISIPFVQNSPYLLVATTIEGHPERLLLDTAADSLAVFADRLTNQGHPLQTLGVGRDISGSVPFTRLTVKQVLVGDNELCGAPVFSIPAMPETRYDGGLAPRILGASKIYFDFERWRFGWDNLKDHVSRCEPSSLSAESGSPP